MHPDILRVDDGSNTMEAAGICTVAQGKLVLAMLFSPVGADLLYQPSMRMGSASPSDRSDNLCASTAPVSRGQIGRAAASYALARSLSRSTDDMESRIIVTSTSQPFVQHAARYGPIFGRALTVSPCRTWQSCMQSHRHRWIFGR